MDHTMVGKKSCRWGFSVSLTVLMLSLVLADPARDMANRCGSRQFEEGATGLDCEALKDDKSTEHGVIFTHTPLAEASAEYVADVKVSVAEDESVSSSGSQGEGNELMTVLLNAFVYSPTPIGKRHLLLAGTSILAVFDDTVFPWRNLVGLPGVKVINLNGSLVVPGLIDIHVHITGGGGELGPASRTPEASLSQLINAGLTTVVGILGTDCVSRSLENLRVKVAALKEEGLTAYMWSGCYRVPSPTLTGSLLRDIILVEEVVGGGEIAISDHRGSWPSADDLLKLVCDARDGGLLSGKAGLLHMHIGQAPTMLDPLWQLMNISKGAIPITQFIPTHVSSRGPALKEAAVKWVGEGGRADLTSDQEGESATFNTLVAWGEKPDFALERLSISSDGFGSLPKYDSAGKLLEYGIASPQASLKTIQRLVHEAGWPLERALQFSTVNPANFLSFTRKGRVEVGMDGDLLVMDAQELQLQYVFAMGQLVKSPTWTKRGMFER